MLVIVRLVWGATLAACGISVLDGNWRQAILLGVLLALATFELALRRGQRDEGTA